MRKFSRHIALFLALVLAMPLQAYAVYAVSECPMVMWHLDSPALHHDCGGCESAGGCALMNFCQALQLGVVAVPGHFIHLLFLHFNSRLSLRIFNRAFSRRPTNRLDPSKK